MTCRVHATLKTVLLAVAALLACAATAAAQSGEYTRCATAGDATIVDVSGTTCDVARAIATALAAAPAADSATVLRIVGWAPLRAAA